MHHDTAPVADHLSHAAQHHGNSKKPGSPSDALRSVEYERGAKECDEDGVGRQRRLVRKDTRLHITCVECAVFIMAEGSVPRIRV